MGRLRGRRLLAWLPTVGWGAAALLIGVSLLRGSRGVEPEAFAWGMGLCVLVALVGHLAAPHAHSQRRVTPAGLERRRGERVPLDRNAAGGHAPDFYHGRHGTRGHPRFD